MATERYRNGNMEVLVSRQDDGAILLNNAADLPALTETLPERLAAWARLRPDSVFLSEGQRQMTYGEAEAERRQLAARLLAASHSAMQGVLILGNNGINHALVMLAATSVGIPVAVVSPAYVNMAGAPWTKIGRVLDQFAPGLIFADRPTAVREALNDLGLDTALVGLQDLEEFGAIDPVPDAEVAAAEATVGADTVAKLLFTSGSTGIPKAVPNTQRMMVSNMQAVQIIWPFLADRPPVLVDWLPWNHTFGGNICFDIALWFGGRMHIDHGKPTAALIDQTMASLREVKPTIYFSTPLGYELLAGQLEADLQLANRFFSGLDFAFNAGAALPAATRSRLEQLWTAATDGPANIVGGWGSTETAPFATVLPFATEHASNLGVPIPGTTLKLVPDSSDGRYELRVSGPNVMFGYWCDDEATRAAFDEQGFYKIGDAGRFVDTEDPAKGILFDGRVAENFKLTSGTFVNVSSLRLSIISACEGLVSDAVIAGEGHSEIGALLFPNRSACLAAVGLESDADCLLSSCEELSALLQEKLRAMNGAATGSSMRLACFRVLDEPANLAEDEITDKGYLNQRRILSRRAGDVDEMFSAGHIC